MGCLRYKYIMNDVLFDLEDVKLLVNKFDIVQNYIELYELSLEIIKLKPKAILEIGCEWGGSLVFWSFLLDSYKKVSNEIYEPKLIGIDIDDKRKYFCYEIFPSVKFKFIKNSSQSDISVGSVDNFLEGQKLDFLFIDGAHGYNECKKDYELYNKFVRKDGIIAFHDLITEENNVRKVFNELNGNKKIINAGNSQGVGLLFK